MNERIRLLAEQAGVNLSSFQFSGTPIKYEIAESELEKFAELIVRECADQFQLVHTDEQYPRRIDKTILKHFGLYK